ncbi:hypothetical protein H3N56_11405 [Cetobacterium sp. 2A]|uniref:hypothetical protein n=1 Tax=Cetobacterium sp. 2A TaxID=2754723 RepID=UPI00163BB925|nr:hypothetical protein [Cetobacterium sp. 2A]MBC2857038.1 hypothetical protein [Cetobacterium sp. 2A]
MFDKKKFEKALIKNYLKTYEEETIIKTEGVYHLAYTTSENGENEYQLNFDSNKMNLIYYIDNKIINQKNYTNDQITELLQYNLIDELLENII